MLKTGDVLRTIDIKTYDVDGRILVCISGMSVQEFESNPELAQTVRETVAKMAQCIKEATWDVGAADNPIARLMDESHV